MRLVAGRMEAATISMSFLVLGTILKLATTQRHGTSFPAIADYFGLARRYKSKCNGGKGAVFRQSNGTV